MLQTRLLHAVNELAHLCLESRSSIATAESCTGGLVAKLITDKAGSSAWFDRGFVTYSNQAKADMLGVSCKTLEQQGAVSEQSVIEMAQGALQNSQADLSVAISGVAGPDGGTADKPVGTVWMAWASRQGQCRTQLLNLEGDREQIRDKAAFRALHGLADQLRSRNS